MKEALSDSPQYPAAGQGATHSPEVPVSSMAPGSANTGLEAARFAAQQLHAASVLRKPPRCRPRTAQAMLRLRQFFTSINASVQGGRRGAEHGRDAQEKGRGCLEEGMGTPREKGQVLQHQLAPEVGTDSCRRE